MTEAMQVELDIFSGRPNPTWMLTSDEMRTVRQLLAQLAPVGDQPLAVHEGLGYRGFILTGTADEGVVSVWRSVVRDATTSCPSVKWDPHRTLEKFLLETARSRLDPALWQFVQAQIDEPTIS